VPYPVAILIPALAKIRPEGVWLKSLFLLLMNSIHQNKAANTIDVTVFDEMIFFFCIFT